MNPSNSNPTRQTFGVINPLTGKIYLDIIDYQLQSIQLPDIKLLPNSVLHLNSDCYLIHMDSKLKKKLKEEGLVRVIVSYQKRTSGNYAECRIWKEKLKLESESIGELK